MATNAVSNIPFRRKRENKTNYAKRLNTLKGRTHRLVIRKSLQGMRMQIVEYHPDGDKILAQAMASELKEFGIAQVNGNIPCAYLTGLLLGVRAKAAGIKSAVADMGMQKSQRGSRLFAAVKGAVDAGLQVPIGKEAIPSEDRLNGKHIAANTVTKYTRYSNVKEYPSQIAAAKQNILKAK